jgi:hypothetical protein
MEIITNNVPRNIVFGYELSGKERSEFDYLDDIESESFVRYRGEVIHLGDFMAWDNPASPTGEKWDGIRTDSYFSGVVIKYVNDYEQVICGLALS